MPESSADMNVTYQTDTANIDWHAVAQLFDAVEWGERKPEELADAFSMSSHVRFVFNDETLIGFGRTVDDGRYYAQIVDLVISPEFKGKGLGSHILTELKDALAGYYFTTLTAASGKESFYSKQGWKRHKQAYIWPRSEPQVDEHVACCG